MEDLTAKVRAALDHVGMKAIVAKHDPDIGVVELSGTIADKAEEIKASDVAVSVIPGVRIVSRLKLGAPRKGIIPSGEIQK